MIAGNAGSTRRRVPLSSDAPCNVCKTRARSPRAAHDAARVFISPFVARARGGVATLFGGNDHGIRTDGPRAHPGRLAPLHRAARTAAAALGRSGRLERLLHPDEPR